MSEEIQKPRSPNSPKMPVELAIETTKKLLEKIGRSTVKPETAVDALGYRGLNGASLTTLGALSHYGLIERENGEVRVSALAFAIVHPVNEEHKSRGIREAALKPKVFSEIHEKWSDMEEKALANTLIHQQFTPEGAKRAASVYKANYVFAKLSSGSKDGSHDDSAQTPDTTRTPESGKPSVGFSALLAAAKSQQAGPKMLATFKVPLGSAEAEIIFTGDKLEAQDFDALAEYVTLFKKQYGRKLGLFGAALEAFLKDGTLPPAMVNTQPAKSTVETMEVD